MPSMNSMVFLQSQRILMPTWTRHVALFATDNQSSHRRPVVPLPEMVGPDEVDCRVVTQDERQRRAYLPVEDPGIWKRPNYSHVCCCQA